MRAILPALAAAAALMLLPPGSALAFDADACERFRARSNEDLAATMRAAGGARTADRECFVRIAMLRLGELAGDEFATVPSAIVHRLVASRFATTADDPLPEHVLRRYADDLEDAEPAPHVDAAARGALAFEETDPDALVAWMRAAEGAEEEGEEGEEAEEAEGEGEQGPVASTAGALALPADPVADPWRADPDFGVLSGKVHLPRGTPPPHPMARDERAGAVVARAGGCLLPGDLRDGDVDRNRAVIERAGLCLGIAEVREGAIRFVFTSIANPHAPDGPVWYLPHDNEQEAFDAAVYAVAQYGGRMVAVNGDETRFFRAVDPNRYFAMTDADARPCAIRRPTPAYTAYVMGLYDGQDEILSIHNNTRGGGVTVDVWTDKSRGFPVPGGPLADPDHLVYIAGERFVADDDAALKRRDALLAQGLNVVHERVTRGNSDCSFSNHVVLNDGRPYYNIEAVHGSRLQKMMVDRLMDILGYPAVPRG